MGTSHTPFITPWHRMKTAKGFHGYLPCARHIPSHRIKTAKGLHASPLATPRCKCLTEILSYTVPLEKSSWCIKPGNFRMNGIAIYKNNRTLLSRIEKISCYSDILMIKFNYILFFSAGPGEVRERIAFSLQLTLFSGAKQGESEGDLRPFATMRWSPSGFSICQNNWRAIGQFPIHLNS